MSNLAHSRRGAGRPVVLLHPIGLDRSCWDAAGDRLARDHEVIAVDLAGHGGSPDREPARTIAEDAAAVAGLIDDIGVGPAAVVGVSFGGMVAQTLALNHPGRVAALVPAACPPRISPENRAAIAARGDKALAEGMQAVVPETLARWFTEAGRDSAEAAAVAARLAADKSANWANAWTAISKFDVLDRLPGIEVPTLCIAGEHDVATPLEAMRAMAAAIPGARLTVLPDAPHMLHIETAAAFADTVAAFLREAG